MGDRVTGWDVTIFHEDKEKNKIINTAAHIIIIYIYFIGTCKTGISEIRSE
jgi:hypothetical protein